MLSNYIKILRFDHWIKQIFVIPGFLYALFVIDFNFDYDFNFYLKIIISLLLISMASSANYVINEFIDGPNDRFHPLKKSRPAARKLLKLKYVLYLYVFLILTTFTMSYYFFGKFYFYIILAFIIMGIFYNVRPFRTKDLKYFDIITESINNPIRFFLGYFTLENNFHFFSPPNIKILLFYFTFGCFLMTCKRLSEKRYFGNLKNIAKYRFTIAKYSENEILLQTFFYSTISLLLVSSLLTKLNDNYFLFIFLLLLTYIEYFNLALNKSYAAQEPENLYKQFFLMILIILSIGIFYYTTMSFY
jgi:4-hydroxybenzoate polyprenyltransferase